MDQVIKELHVYDNYNDDSAYRLVHGISNEELVIEQSSVCDLLELPSMGGINYHKQLSTIYGLTKMHKATPKLRFIVASCKSLLKSLDLTVTKCFGVIMLNYCKGICNYTGTNIMCILDNSLQLKLKIHECNKNMTAHRISTWDFSSLYTTIPHQLLKDTISELIYFSFKKNKKNYIAFNSFRAFQSVR